MLRYRCGGVCLALLGLALLLVGAVGVLIVPDLVADERAFRAARPCVGAATGDCLRSVPATVRGTLIREQPRNYAYVLELDGPRPVPGDLDMGGADPLLKDLRAGDRVTVTLWRDYAIAVGKDGVTQYSSDSPEGEPQVILALALAFLPLGAFAAHAGGKLVVRARDYAAQGPPGHLVPLGKRALGAAVCALPAGLFGLWWGGPIAVAVMWVLLAGALWVLTGRRETTGGGRHARPLESPR
ncbi:hypothetical protein [Streptomyces antibioticus]|uniref:hypothetical protein n=1 Tax=Streptomyces antibioticus TaxID=1890 RepID=UPI00224E7E8C|nr:hypothetical protein [Streptomyces antibioticus]MCX4738994.1 hypothetical protein [Streptomyces antibioticus]